MNAKAGVPEPRAYGLEATLDTSEEIARGEAVRIQFTLTNTADETLIFLKWFTPLEGLAGDIFRITRDGDTVPYQGILAKRVVPGPDEYITLAPKASVATEVDLANAYDWSIPGEYNIEYLSPSISHVISQEMEMAKRQRHLGPVQIPSNQVTVKVSDSDEQPSRSPLSPDEIEAAEQAKVITYDNCTSSEENTVYSAQSTAAFKLAFVCSDYKTKSEAERQADVLYDTWFGQYTATRYAKVLSNLQKIQEGFGGDVTYNCSGPACQSSWVAYVYLGSPREVFLCNQFWTRPESGTDTNYGTLVHEISHEDAGTKDHTYGYLNCQNLAQNQPEKAIENADSYQYFVEEYTLPDCSVRAVTSRIRPVLGIKARGRFWGI